MAGAWSASKCSVVETGGISQWQQSRYHRHLTHESMENQPSLLLILILITVFVLIRAPLKIIIHLECTCY